MAKIDPGLLEKIKARLGISRARAYSLIAATAQQLMLDNRLAAIALANQNGINVNRFATTSDLAEIRGTARPPTVTSAGPPPPAKMPRRSVGPKKIGAKKPKGKAVWVVHGRNTKLRDSLFDFLRAIGLEPLEFSKAVILTGKAAPYIGEILDAAFAKAAAVVVLLTPDDEARLKPEFQKSGDPQ